MKIIGSHKNTNVQTRKVPEFGDIVIYGEDKVPCVLVEDDSWFDAIGFLFDLENKVVVHTFERLEEFINCPRVTEATLTLDKIV